MAISVLLSLINFLLYVTYYPIVIRMMVIAIGKLWHANDKLPQGNATQYTYVSYTAGVIYT